MPNSEVHLSRNSCRQVHPPKLVLGQRLFTTIRTVAAITFEPSRCLRLLQSRQNLIVSQCKLDVVWLVRGGGGGGDTQLVVGTAVSVCEMNKLGFEGSFPFKG